MWYYSVELIYGFNFGIEWVPEYKSVLIDLCFVRILLEKM